MSDRLAEIAARHEKVMAGFSRFDTTWPEADALVTEDVPWLLAEIKQFTDERDSIRELINSELGPTWEQFDELFARIDAAEAGIKQHDELLARALDEFVPNHDSAVALAEKIGLGPLPNSDLVTEIRAALAGVGCTDTEPQGPEAEGGDDCKQSSVAEERSPLPSGQALNLYWATKECTCAATITTEGMAVVTEHCPVHGSAVARAEDSE